MRSLRASGLAAPRSMDRATSGVDGGGPSRAVAVARDAAGALGEERQVPRRAVAPVPVRPRREAARAAMSVASSPRGPDRPDRAGDVLGERLRVRPAPGEAPGAQPGGAGATG